MQDVCGELEAQILDTMNANVDFEEEIHRMVSRLIRINKNNGRGYNSSVPCEVMN